MKHNKYYGRTELYFLIEINDYFYPKANEKNIFSTNSAQWEILNMISLPKKFNRLLESGSLDNDKIENFRKLHQRTAYR
ncbi:MAG: hypothetical protein II852_15850 [Bacteroidales bacterium]|nr:hypothetical protein [Bacteroidales bacterium]